MYDSRSTFVPVFLSNRLSANSPQHALHNDFEYLGPAQRTGTDLSEQSNLSTVSMPHKERALFGEQDLYESSLARSEPSSASTKSHSKSSPQQTKSCPKASRTASSSTKSSRTKASTRTRPRPRRKISYTTRLRVAVESKLRLTIAFGFSVFASLIIYIALFVTKTSSGAVFHALSVLLLLSLSGVTIHSFVRFLALNSELKAHRSHRAGLKKNPSARGWNISRPLPQFPQPSILDEKSDAIGQADGGYENDEFPVFYARYSQQHNPFYDEHNIEAHPQPLQHPPPVYGNTRSSIVCLHLDPPFPLHDTRRRVPSSSTYCHLHCVVANLLQRLSINPSQIGYTPSRARSHLPDPNITAPAPVLAPGMPGWHPPSFRSEGGITAVLEHRRREVEKRLGGRGGAAATSRKAGNGVEDENRGSGLLLGRGRFQPTGGMI